jgi:hypothetical protein
MHWIGFGWMDFNPKMVISGAASDLAALRTWVESRKDGHMLPYCSGRKIDYFVRVIMLIVESAS